MSVGIVLVYVTLASTYHFHCLFRTSHSHYDTTTNDIIYCTLYCTVDDGVCITISSYVYDCSSSASIGECVQHDCLLASDAATKGVLMNVLLHPYYHTHHHCTLLSTVVHDVLWYIMPTVISGIYTTTT